MAAAAAAADTPLLHRPPTPRHRTRLVGGALAAMGCLVALSQHAEHARAPPPELRGDARLRADTEAPPADKLRVEIPMTEFLRFPLVVDWLRKQGVEERLLDSNATLAERGALLAYLPARFVVTMDARAVAGRLGSAAAGGYVAFSLFSGSTASWNIIMDLTGKLHQMSPARSVQSYGQQHWCGLKNYDEDTLLLVSSVNQTATNVATCPASGHAYLWNWRKNEYTRLGGSSALYGAHDIQWSSDVATAGSKDSFWNPSPNAQCCENNNVSLHDANTGATLFTVRTGFADCVPDVNHAQLLDDDAHAVLSLRMLSAVAKYRTADSEREWIIGGPHGEWPIHDVNGSVYPPGTTVWREQHNPEYMGDGEIWMFDDLGAGNVSRLLIVGLDERARVARIKWSYELPGLSEEFGDCDPTPAGNVLGSYWRSHVSDASPERQVQSGIIEVVRNTSEVAWHLQIWGDACPDANCFLSSKHEGWMMFSVERFYDAPLLFSPAAGGGASGGASGGDGPVCLDGELAFSTWNSFKQSSVAPGTFELREGAQLAASGAFRFEAHWRPTIVRSAVNLTNATAEVELVVRNNRGRAVRHTMRCAESEIG